MLREPWLVNLSDQVRHSLEATSVVIQGIWSQMTQFSHAASTLAGQDVSGGGGVIRHNLHFLRALLSLQANNQGSWERGPNMQHLSRPAPGDCGRMDMQQQGSIGQCCGRHTPFGGNKQLLYWWIGMPAKLRSGAGASVQIMYVCNVVFGGMHACMLLP